MDAYYTNPLIFLIDTLAGLYVLALMLRFLLQWNKADFYNPICQFLVKITHPPLKFMRRLIPSIGNIDTASIVLMLLLQMLIGLVIFSLQGGQISPAALALWSVAELIDLFLNILLFSIFLVVLLSWFNPGYNPATELLHSLTEPVLKPARRIIPSFSGVDLSAMLILMGIQVLRMLILPPLQEAIRLLA